MKSRLWAAAAVLCWACGNSSTPQEKVDLEARAPKEEKAPSAVRGGGDVAALPAPKKVEPAESKPLPNPRISLLEREWNAYKDLLVSHSAETLSEGEKEMLRHLLEVGRLIEELHMLQIHPDNLAWRDLLAASGSELERKIFSRNQMPWCEDNDNPECVAVEAAGPKIVGRVFWPEGFDAARHEALSREINAKELLSPFTVVRNKKPRGYRAIPYVGFDLFGPKMRKVALSLKAAAQNAPNPSLKKFLLSRADAFLSPTPFPYDQSDYDWIALKGDWEITVGPYETYKSPFQTKALFEMIIGQEDKALTDSLRRLKKSMQGMENALALLVGEDVYKPRKLNSRIAIRAVNVWAAFGDGRHSRGAVLAYHLPNRGTSVDAGMYKKVILINHAEAFESISRARAAELLDAPQRDMLSLEDDIINTAFHELAHGFGAYHEMRIKDPAGRLTTVKEALREYDSLLEELKADTLGLWLSKAQNDNKALDNEGLKRRYVSSVTHMLGLLQYPVDDTYTQMAATALGRLMDNGGLAMDETTGRVSIDFEKMGDALTSLVKETATIQLTGDYAAAKTMVGAYLDKREDGFFLKGKPARLRESVLEKFKKGKIKTPSLRYEVTGL